MSSLTTPSPLHLSQRPPGILKLNRPGPYPRILLSEHLEKRLRNWSKSFTYVAGFERGLFPIGD